MKTRPIVLDTNIVLDLLVFVDDAARPLDEALRSGELTWLATQGMQAELARVLEYPQIAKRLARRALLPATVMDGFQARASLVGAAPKAPFTCADADDQQFIDLAAAHGALLISKDAEVLCMRKRLATLGVTVSPTFTAEPAVGV